MTVYNEADFIRFAMSSCLDLVDHLVIVEGAYQETIKLGASPRSTDGTIEKIKECKKVYDQLDGATAIFNRGGSKIHYIEANEQTDKDQRNVGLKKIKELDSDWLLIIDGDEVFNPNTFKQIRNYCNLMDKNNKKVSYFQSLTFVNDLDHFCYQKFPRLFKIEPNCKFVNDNYMHYEDLPVFGDHIIENLNIKYFHFAFVKGLERFEIKKKWWETRFGKPFDYGWHVGEDGKLQDTNHKIYEFTGKLPKILDNHPLRKT